MGVKLRKANKGEWGEPYVALYILGHGKIFIADDTGKKNPDEWMSVLQVIRNELDKGIVTYNYDVNTTDVDIRINDKHEMTVPAKDFLHIAGLLAENIKNGKGNTFSVDEEIEEFLMWTKFEKFKQKSADKSDIYLTVSDPRSSVVRNRIGFSIKTKFGHNPTLFNTAKASAAIYRVTGMDDSMMEKINTMLNSSGDVSVLDRCEYMKNNGCELHFAGFPVARKAKCRAFEENLNLIDTRLATVISSMLYNHFFLKVTTEKMLKDIMKFIIAANPCHQSRPEVIYPYAMKSFLYASYCGMTASTLWDGRSNVNGGFISVDENGEVLAYYALESDAFKEYLYTHCYLEFPSTDVKHGDYGYVYKENDEYYFKLNFQIRYR